MDDSQKIAKIREIYNNFLLKLNQLKEKADNQRNKKNELNKQKEISEILAKIHNDF